MGVVLGAPFMCTEDEFQAVGHSPEAGHPHCSLYFCLFSSINFFNVRVHTLLSPFTGLTKRLLLYPFLALLCK